MTAARRWPWLPLAVLVIGLMALVAGCRPQSTTPAPKAPGLVKHFGAEPLTLELRLDRERLTVAEQLTVELRAETDETYTVKFTEAKEFAGFTVVSASEPKAEMTAAGRVAVTMRYTLEPLASGELKLPVLTVEAWKKGEEQAAISTARTEALPVVVESLLAKDDLGQTISDIAPPLAKPLNPWLLIGAAVAGLLVLALLVLLWRRRRRRIIPPPPPLPPHLIAYQALDLLLAAGLLESGQIKAFYERLSAILRHYIEQRFGLRAPERTTEEFLAELGAVGEEANCRPAASFPPTLTLNAVDLSRPPATTKMVVIPAQAGIQSSQAILDPGLRRGDGVKRCLDLKSTALPLPPPRKGGQGFSSILAGVGQGLSPIPADVGQGLLLPKSSLPFSNQATLTAHKMLLRDFLNHCDLVKFARHTPARAEAEEGVERCRRFIRETEPVPNLDSQAGGAP